MRCLACVLSLLVLTSAVAQADTVSLSADRDNSLYAAGDGSGGDWTGTNFGASVILKVGQVPPYYETSSPILSFDVNALSAGTVDSITLRLHVDSYYTDGTGPATLNPSVHAILASNKGWVEGTGGDSGIGDTQNGSCHKWLDSTPTGNVDWASGGPFGSSDYSATVLATRSLAASDNGTYVDFNFSGTGAALTSLVDGWRTDNGGLLVWTGSTGAGITVATFDSKEGLTAAYAPELILTGSITMVPEPSSFMLLACGLIGLLAYAWRKLK